MGTVDVYSWAMSFYSLILSKSPDSLTREANYYKVGSEKEYDNFMKSIKDEVNKIDIKDSKKIRIKDFIFEQIFKGLSFKPENRPKMSEVAENMKEFEKKETLIFPYMKSEQEYKKKLLKSIMIEVDFDINYVKETEEAKKTLDKLKELLIHTKEECDELSKRLVKNREDAMCVCILFNYGSKGKYGIIREINKIK